MTEQTFSMEDPREECLIPAPVDHDVQTDLEPAKGNPDNIDPDEVNV